MTSLVTTSVRRRGLAAIVAAALLATMSLVTGLIATGASARPSDKTPAVSPRSQLPAFVLDHGRYRSFEASDPAVQLAPFGINNRGVIVGEYLTPTGESGFRRDKRGRIKRIDLPGVAGTQVDKVNERGQIVGNYSEISPFLPGDGSRGYVLDRGRVTRIDVPGARVTVPHDINNRGQIVGSYNFAEFQDHGFLWRHGRLRSFDVPGAAFTQALAINDRRWIVGIYGDPDGAIHGFLLRDGVYTTIDAPGATVTLPLDINNRGQIVGSSSSPTPDDPLAGTRGFVLRDGVNGPFTEVAFPGAPRTLAAGINDRGEIVGIFENPNATTSAQRAHASAVPLSDTLPVSLLER